MCSWAGDGWLVSNIRHGVRAAAATASLRDAGAAAAQPRAAMHAPDGRGPCRGGAGAPSGDDEGPGGGPDDMDAVFGDGGADAPVDGVPGLVVANRPPPQSRPLARGFTSPEESAWLLASATATGWATGGANNQAMCFGGLPAWVDA
eukprot:gene33983-54077_t